MPRGNKSSELARAIETVQGLLTHLTQMQMDFKQTMVDAEAYRKLKPAIKSLAEAVNPVNPPPIGEPVNPPPNSEPVSTGVAKKRTRRIKKALESEPKTTEPDEHPGE